MLPAALQSPASSAKARWARVGVPGEASPTISIAAAPTTWPMKTMDMQGARRAPVPPTKSAVSIADRREQRQRDRDAHVLDLLGPSRFI